jgi:hypothetical protein
MLYRPPHFCGGFFILFQSPVDGEKAGVDWESRGFSQSTP